MIPFTSKKQTNKQTNLMDRKPLFAPTYTILPLVPYSVKWFFNGALSYAELFTCINLLWDKYRSILIPTSQMRKSRINNMIKAVHTIFIHAWIATGDQISCCSSGVDKPGMYITLTKLLILSFLSFQIVSQSSFSLFPIPHRIF